MGSTASEDGILEGGVPRDPNLDGSPEYVERVAIEISIAMGAGTVTVQTRMADRTPAFCVTGLVSMIRSATIDGFLQGLVSSSSQALAKSTQLGKFTGDSMRSANVHTLSYMVLEALNRGTHEISKLQMDGEDCASDRERAERVGHHAGAGGGDTVPAD